MRFWLDTEFNDFKGELISIALIDDDGLEWYEVLEWNNPSPWVAENVIPVLHQAPVRIRTMQHSLHNFLRNYDAVHVVADWPEDIQHFCAALITRPGERIDTPPLTLEVRRDLDTAGSLMPHNALADARALRLLGLGHNTELTGAEGVRLNDWLECR